MKTKKLVSLLLCMIMVISTITTIAIAVEPAELSVISLSENVSFYSSKVPEGTKLKVTGFDQNGDSVDLTGKSISYHSTRPWVFDIDVDGTIIDNGYDGTTIITATVDEISGSFIMIKSTSETVLTSGFETDKTTTGSATGENGYAYYGYKSDASTLTDANSRIAGQAYITGETGALTYEGSWDNQAQIRVAQGWFYDTLEKNAAINIVLGTVNPRTYYYSNYEEGATPDLKEPSQLVPAWAKLGLDESIHSALIAKGASDEAKEKRRNNGYFINSKTMGSATASGNHKDINYYTYSDNNYDSVVKRTKGWHQVTLIVDDDANVKMYIDGIEVNTTVSEEKILKHSNAVPKSNISGWFGSGIYDDFVFAQNLNTEQPEGFASTRKFVVTVDGAAYVGQTLTANIEIKDGLGDLEGETYQWQVEENGSWNDIADATTASFKPTAAYIGKKLRVVVTPTSGASIESAATDAVEDGMQSPSITNFKVEGTYEAGQTIKVSYKYQESTSGNKEGDTQIIFEMADSSDGEFTAVQDSTKSTYEIKNADIGKWIRVRVIPKDILGIAGDFKLSDAKKIGGAVAFYVATNGDDSNPGTVDQPFATLEAARDALREIEIPITGATVYIREGTYKRTEAFELTAEDSGVSGGPIVYRPYGNEKVVLHGGYDLKLKDFAPVEGEMKNLLYSDAQSKVLVADLAALGVEKIGEYKDVGSSDGLHIPVMSLDGKPLNIARYPNDGDIGSWPTFRCAPREPGYEGTNLGNGKTDEARAFTIKYDDQTANRVANWSYGMDHIAIEGYLMYDWWSTTRYVTIDKDKHFASARLKDNNGENNGDTYRGVRENQTRSFRFINVYQEMDQEGEFYIDFESQKMYVYPYKNWTEDSAIKMNNLATNMIEMTDVSNVTIQGIELTSGRNNAIRAKNSNNITIDNCYINGFLRRAFEAIDGNNYNFTITNNDMEFFGTGGIRFTAGDRKTLTSGNVKIVNNKINDFSMNKTSYASAVNIRDSVGSLVSHNEIYNCDHAAIEFTGVDNIIEYNIIHNACTNSADMGAIYTGAHLDDHGTIIRYNYFYDIGSRLSRQYFPCAIFSDDGSCDSDIYGNVFGKGLNYCEAVKIHGGQFNNVYHNMFVDTPLVVNNSEWSDLQWRRRTLSIDPSYTADRYLNLLASVWKNPAYTQRWPWLAVSAEAYDAYIASGNDESKLDPIVNHSNEFAENLLIYVDKEPREIVRDTFRPTSYEGWFTSYNYHPVYGTNDEGGNTNVFITPDDQDTRKLFEDFDNGNLRLVDESIYNLFDEYTFKEGDFEPIPFDEIGMYDLPDNKDPEAFDVTINQLEEDVLKGSYRYSDAEGDPEDGTTYRWLISDTIDNENYTPVADATANTLNLTAEMSGKFIKFEVTVASADNNKGVPVLSAAFAVVTDKDSLNKIITSVETVADNVTIGSELGKFTQGSVTEIKNVIEAAKAVIADEDATYSDLVAAAAELTSAYDTLLKSENTQTSTNKAEVTVPDGLSDVEITFTGDQNELTVSFEGETAPATKITAGNCVVTIEEGTVIPGGQLKITVPDTTSIKVYGDLKSVVTVGKAGDTFNKPVRIEFAGNVSEDIIYINDTYEKIRKVLNEDNADALSSSKYGKISAGAGKVAVWTVAGGEYAAVAGLYEPASDLTELTKVIDTATELVKNAVIGTENGTFTQESVDALQKAIDDATAVAKNPKSEQHEVNNSVKELENAIDKFKSSENLILEFMNINKILESSQGWVNKNGQAITDEYKDGKLVLTQSKIARYTAKKYGDTIFNFKLRFETVGENLPAINTEKDDSPLYAINGGAFKVRGQNTTGDVFNATSDYGLLAWFKNSVFEIQEWTPANTDKIFTYENDVFTEFNKDYNVSYGAFDTVDGTRVVMYVDGKLVVDHTCVDAKNEGLEGYLTFRGCMLDKVKMVISAADTDLTELNKLISETEKFVANAEIGTGYNQYTKKNLEKLEAVIADAKELAAEETVAQIPVDRKVLELKQAMKDLKATSGTEIDVSSNSEIEIDHDIPKAEINATSNTPVSVILESSEPTPEIILTTKTNKGTVSLEIPDGTLLSGENWNGKITNPVYSETPSAKVSTNLSLDAVYTTGETTVNAKGLVRFVFPGAKGKKVYYLNESGRYVEVTRRINEDSYAAAENAVGSKGTAKLTSGNDIIVYSSYITEYIVCTDAATDEDDESVSDVKPSLGNAGSTGGGGFFTSPTITPSADVNNTFVFSDMTNHWAKADVMNMYKAGIVSGVTANTFEPDRSITRAEFATLIAKGLKLKLEKTNDFADVAATDWFAPYVGAAAKAGIIVGANGNFRPNDTITREEMAVIIVKAYTYRGGKGANGAIDNFSDKAKISAWAKAYVDSAASTGLISGMGDGTFGPKANATRAQAASVIYRVIK